LAVAAVGRHRLVRVARRDDPCAEGNLLPREAIRIAVTVPALMRSANDHRDRSQRWGGVQDPLAEQRVLAHEVPLRPRERACLVEDGIGYADLTHVMQLGRADELV